MMRKNRARKRSLKRRERKIWMWMYPHRGKEMELMDRLGTYHLQKVTLLRIIPFYWEQTGVRQCFGTLLHG